MNLLDEFFHAHRHGKGMKHRAAPKPKLGESLDVDAIVFHSSPTISFSMMDVFKAGILWAEIGARERQVLSEKDDSESPK